MTPAQVAFQEEPAPTDGLRSRKKLKTRRAIQDAALDLFAERGYEATTVDEIAARAEVSTTTFFAYFRSKSEVIMGDRSQRLPALREGILQRPATENDLEAVRRAVLDQWVPAIDPHRTARFAEAIRTSHVLRGLSFDVGLAWLATITDALAGRHGLDAPDETCSLTARAAMMFIHHALESWILADCRGDLAAAVDEAYALMAEVSATWFAGSIDAGWERERRK